MALDYEEEHSKLDLQSYLNTAPYEPTRAAPRSRRSRVEGLFRPAAAHAAPGALLDLPQAPTDYNPISNAGGAIERRNEVLSNMADPATSARSGPQASKAGLCSSRNRPVRLPAVIFRLRRKRTDQEYGVNTVRQGGLRVHTTIEPPCRKPAAAMQSNLPIGRSFHRPWYRRPQDRRGMMVSSSSHPTASNLLAAQGRRRDDLKTFTLTTAIEQGMDPNSTYYVSKRSASTIRPMATGRATYGDTLFVR
jgi:penicillin-binding protein 1A